MLILIIYLIDINFLILEVNNKMVIDRPMVKSRAKEVLRASYLKSVAVSLVLFITLYGVAGSSATNSGASTEAMQAGSYTAAIPMSVAALILGFAGILMLIMLLIRVFVLNILEIGCRRFFMETSYGDTGIGVIVKPFSRAYLNQAFVMFMRDLFTCLWTMLFVIPGFIKMYSYRLVPYILAEEPEMSMSEAIGLSRSMMDGYKWQTFIFDLSFIGWMILSGITFGLVGVFYSNPYYNHASAQLYLYIKEQRGTM